MNLSINEAETLARQIKNGLADEQSVDVIIAPPFLYLEKLTHLLKNTSIRLAAQNAYHEATGAFTGEISPYMLDQLDIPYVIIGHSERRSYFKETNAMLARKVSAAIENGLQVIFCVGEQLHQREAGQHESAVATQLHEGLFLTDTPGFSKVIIAYEPVWAIGTGKTATSTQAQEMHAFIREQIAAAYTEKIAMQTAILYGGSCKPRNAAELFRQVDIDGGLIGGASLHPEEFLAIISAMSD